MAPRPQPICEGVIITARPCRCLRNGSAVPADQVVHHSQVTLCTVPDHYAVRQRSLACAKALRAVLEGVTHTSVTSRRMLHANFDPRLLFRALVTSSVQAELSQPHALCSVRAAHFDQGVTSVWRFSALALAKLLLELLGVLCWLIIVN